MSPLGFGVLFVKILSADFTAGLSQFVCKTMSIM